MGPDQGELELSVTPGKTVSAWTQQELELGLLQYKHKNTDETTVDSFTFIVSDGYVAFLSIVVSVHEILYIIFG